MLAQMLGVFPGANRGHVDHPLGMARSTVSVQLNVDSAREPISGSLVYPDGRELAFAGWIELTAALEEARQLQPLDVIAHGEKRPTDPARTQRSASSDREGAPDAHGEPIQDE